MICPLLLLYIRWLLRRENKKRDAEPADDKYDDVYIEVVLADGTRAERRVDKVRRAEFRLGVALTSNLCRNSWT